MGRERVLAAAVELLADADLADLLSFLGTRAVAERADVQPATVHHHFHNRADNPKANARMAEAVLDACLSVENTRRTADELTALDDRADPDLGEIGALREIATANLQRLLDDRSLAVGVLIGAAAAGNDPVARSHLRETYDSILDQYVKVFEGLAAFLGRRFDETNGFTAETMSVLGTALADGLVLRHQFDPDRVRPDLFAELSLRIFEALTVPEDTDEPTDAVTERLLRRSSTVDLPPGSGLDGSKRARIVETARRLYDEGGAAALSVSAVAREANVSRQTVLANFGDRTGLAAAVWAQFLPDLERRLETDRERGMPLPRLLERHLHRLLDRGRAEGELSALFVAGIVNSTVKEGATDPRSSVPLVDALASLLVEESAQLRAGLAESPGEAVDLATTIIYLALARTMARPDESTTEIVHQLSDLLFEGILPK